MTATLPLFDTAALRTLEAHACALLGGDDFELMRRAGQAAWRHALDHWPQVRDLLVVCGPGNNGGDGYVLARHAMESGRNVVVARLAAHQPRTVLAQRACEEYETAGGRIIEFDASLPGCGLVVDALFGIGLSRDVDDAAAALIAAIHAAGVPVLSLDVPSGLDGDTGQCRGSGVCATRTLQFIAAHVGLHTGDAIDYTGSIAVASLDVPTGTWDGVAPVAELLRPQALVEALPRRRRNTHKGRNGHVLCVGGELGMGGALALCAEGALRAGAGLTSVATRGEHVAAVLSRLPECMCVGVESADDIATLLLRADVVAAGPGLGQSDWARGLLEAALSSGKHLVLDADALNLLAIAPRALGGAVLTPHPGEAARLLGIDTTDVQRDRVATANSLARKFECAIVLKGAGSIVAAPGRTPQIIAAGNPGMAVGGMGDVLTGVVAALRAQGMDAFDAARFGALLHAHAGDLAARDGERGMLPSDLLACVRAAANPSSAS